MNEMTSLEASSPMASQIIARHFEVLDGELRIDGVGVRGIADKIGTPAYIYSSRVLESSLQCLRGSLSSRFDVHYSVKANPNQSILRFFIREGCGLEVASQGELAQAIAAGCEPSRIVYAGPGKTDADLEFALRQEIHAVHLESLSEAARAAAIGQRLGRVMPVALRINPVAASLELGAMQMGGRASPFGIDEEQLDEAVRWIVDNPNLDFLGVHMYAATQILDATALGERWLHAVKIASRAAVVAGFPVRQIDFGGGLGTPYFPHENHLDLAQVALAGKAVAQRVESDPLLSQAQLIVEPGRFLMAEAGIYLIRVIEVKESRGKRFVIADGGMHQHLAASGNLGQAIKRNFPLAAVTRLEDACVQTVDLVGPLCTPLDTLGRAVLMPELVSGDLIGVFQSGAYARAASPLNFLSHPSPPEAWVQAGNVHQIRLRSKNEDFLRDQVAMEVSSHQAETVCPHD